jgi:hypothetical protein
VCMSVNERAFSNIGCGVIVTTNNNNGYQH